MSRASVLLALLLSCASTREHVVQPATPCTNAKDEAVRYFGEGASFEQTWEAMRLCKMGEPPLLASRAPEVRCAYYWAFHPFVAIRLSEGECSAEIRAWEDRDEHHPRLVGEVRQVSRCSEIHRQLRDSVASGNQTPTGTSVFLDGGTVSLESAGIGGHTFGFNDLTGGIAPASKLTLACDALARALGFSAHGDRDDSFGAVTLALRDTAEWSPATAR